MQKTVITYGTFDLLHLGHVRILERAKKIAGPFSNLIVFLSTDEFQKEKGKPAPLTTYEYRKYMLESLKFVDLVLPEDSWGQKKSDIERFNASFLVMGDDWAGEFNDLEGLGANLCTVVYVPRTDGISTSEIKKRIWNTKKTGRKNNI